VRILLVEDDALLGGGIRDALDREQFSVEWVTGGREAAAALHATSFDLVILDLGLPGKDGLEVLRELRARGDKTPVLVLSARDAPSQRVHGLDTGADDYLVKPFDLDELFARVRALQRRSRGAAVPGSRSVTYEGHPVALQRREYTLLERLLQSTGQVLSRSQLEESLYGWDGGAESNSLDVHIHHLRRKLYPGIIRTVRGVGYIIDQAQPRPGG